MVVDSLLWLMNRNWKDESSGVGVFLRKQIIMHRVLRVEVGCWLVKWPRIE
jgi:hypothetical protein